MSQYHPLSHVIVQEHDQANIQQYNAVSTKCLGQQYCLFMKIMYTGMEHDNANSYNLFTYMPCVNVCDIQARGQPQAHMEADDQIFDPKLDS